MVDITGLLRYVTEGMEVYDLEGDQIGTVQFVKLGDDTIAAQVAHGDEYAAEIAAFAQTLTENHVILEERDRLIREGFVRVDSGLLRADRYILPHQIEEVTDLGVWLNVSRDGLLKG